ncbi:MAG: YiiX/YebB-like N1pC/P60 family cysteine hydrolase, partial [Desulfatiglandales bacterium]|nr:YiiX/YebB-like N1pC/P60 family cysteine hydrolase [Desulfatiglandales bacterium]
AYRLKPQYRPLIPKFLKNLHPHAGKPYDFKYEFTDDKLYCSELVFHAWKKSSNKDMGKRENVLSLNWKPYLATIEKYNQGPLPTSGRMLISPRSLSRARQLERVYNHGLDQ